MQQRQLGDSNLKVTEIIFGAWAIGGWMWGPQDEGDAVKAIETAIDLGMTTIDTAAVYGYGRSEELVGRAIRPKRDKVQVLTKYGLRWDCEDGQYHFEWAEPDWPTRKIYKNGRMDSVVHECEQSLKRLGIDCIDLYQCHWRDETTPLAETMAAMDKLHKDGKIRAAGVSNFTVEWLAEARKAFPVAAVQPPYSMVDRGIENDVLPYCRENNIGVIVYSPLQRGLLTGKFRPDHKFKDGDHRADDAFFRPESIRKVNAFLARVRPIAEAHGATLAQLAIRWTIDRPGITAALVGARSEKQARENARAAELSLSAEETARIDALLNELD